MRSIQHIHIESIGGIAGDMLLGALIDAGADVDAITQTFSSINIQGLRLQWDHVTLNGLRAVHVQSLVGSALDHDEESHAHHHFSDILAILNRAAMSAKARQLAVGIFEKLVWAESQVHGETPDEVHLHEVGELDSILDVVGIAVAIDSMGHPTFSCSPLVSGSGFVKFSHGKLPVPTPAVRCLAERYGVPLVSAEIDGETITPTGIAVLTHLSPDYLEKPVRRPLVVGIGAGTKRFASIPNVIKVHCYDTAI